MSTTPPASTACPICGSLPQTYLAQTGYGERFPPAAGQLVSLEIDNSRDIWRCPACGDLFEWEDIPQHYGSGNLDEERLTRLSPLQAKLAQDLLAPDLGGAAPAELIPSAARELGDLIHSILSRLCYHTSSFDRLVAPLAQVLANGNDQRLVTILRSWATRNAKERQSRLTFLVGQLEACSRPLSRFGQVLLDLCRDDLPSA